MHASIHPDFQRLIASLGHGLVPTTPRSLELLFDDDLPVTLRMLANETDIAVDIWCHDLSSLPVPSRRLAVRALLMLNVGTGPDGSCVIGMDARDFVLVHGRHPLASLEADGFASWFGCLLAHARRVRALLAMLAQPGKS